MQALLHYLHFVELINEEWISSNLLEMRRSLSIFSLPKKDGLYCDLSFKIYVFEKTCLVGSGHVDFPKK